MVWQDANLISTIAKRTPLNVHFDDQLDSQKGRPVVTTSGSAGSRASALQKQQQKQKQLRVEDAQPNRCSRSRAHSYLEETAAGGIYAWQNNAQRKVHGTPRPRPRARRVEHLSRVVVLHGAGSRPPRFAVNFSVFGAASRLCWR